MRTANESAADVDLHGVIPAKAGTQDRRLRRPRGKHASFRIPAFAGMTASLLLGLAFAQQSAIPLTSNDPALEARVKALSAELRCLVCQNQTVADSDAPVARDLREQVRTQLAAGKSEAEVKQYMTERFGDFVLYKPPLKAETAILWLGPFAVLLIAAFLLMRRIGRRADTSAATAEAGSLALSAADRERARALLQSDPGSRP